LHLIKGSKLDIKEVKLAEVTKQYLEYMKQLDDLPLEEQGEFIEIAASLLEIKSKAMLPRPEIVKESEEDLEDNLKKRIEEFKVYKEASEKLKEIEAAGRFYKEPTFDKNNEKVVLNNFSYDKLIEAFTKLLTRVNTEEVVAPIKQIAKDVFTVTEKIASIRERLQFADKVNFFDLFSAVGQISKNEIITTFMALLELLKRAQIKVVQETKYADIAIEKNEMFGAEVILEDEVK
jgi:segregation and condensation protein A